MSAILKSRAGLIRESEAKICEAVRRLVKVDIVILFWTLVLAPASGMAYSLSRIATPVPGESAPCLGSGFGKPSKVWAVRGWTWTSRSPTARNISRGSALRSVLAGYGLQVGLPEVFDEQSQHGPGVGIFDDELHAVARRVDAAAFADPHDPAGDWDLVLTVE